MKDFNVQFVGKDGDENKKGVSTKELSERYYLSLKSIQRIILQVKREVES